MSEMPDTKEMVSKFLEAMYLHYPQSKPVVIDGTGYIPLAALQFILLSFMDAEDSILALGPEEENTSEYIAGLYIQLSTLLYLLASKAIVDQEFEGLVGGLDTELGE